MAFKPNGSDLRPIFPETGIRSTAGVFHAFWSELRKQSISAAIQGRPAMDGRATRKGPGWPFDEGAVT